MLFVGSRSAEAGKPTHNLAPAGDQGKPHADSAGLPGRLLDSPRRRALGEDLSARPPSRLQRVVGPLHGVDGQLHRAPYAIRVSRIPAATTRAIPRTKTMTSD